MNAKAILRVFGKHRFYSAINIIGLSTGFALCMVIYLILAYDYNHDRAHPDAERIYRLNAEYVTPSRTELYAISSRFLGPQLVEKIPEIEAYGRFSRSRRRIVKVKENYFFENDLLYSDQESIDLFEPKFLLGNPRKVLTEANQIILTQSKAIQWFGELSRALNETISVDGKPFQISGIIEDLPPNLHLQYKGLLSHKSLEERFAKHKASHFLLELWNAEYFTYIRLAKGVNHDVVKDKSQAFIEDEVYPLIRARGIEEDYKLGFVPLPETHFETESTYNMPTGDMGFFNVTLLIGLILLIIICINYANLSMALLSTRTKELGMKKVLGATKKQIVLQLIIESIFYVLISLIIAYGLSYLIVKSQILDNVIDRSLDFSILFKTTTLLTTLCAGILLAILSSFYPALKYSNVKLHEVAYSKKKSNTLRSLLITVQFIASLLVITSMVMMKLQLNHINKYNIGITDDPMFIVDMTDSRMVSQANAIKQSLSGLSSVKRVTDVKLSSKNHLLGSYSRSTQIQQETGDFKERILQSAFISNNFSKTFGLELLEGRDFGANLLSDTTKVIVNQSLVKALDWNQPIGKKIRYTNREFEVIGVVKDFHYKSLKEEIEPLALYKKDVYSGSKNIPRTSFHIATVKGMKTRAMQEIEGVFQQFYPEIPFEFVIMEDKVKGLYAADKKESQLTAFLGYVAVIIALLGLVGLSSFEVNQRTKEISIRKVLGANMSSIFVKLSIKQIRLIIIAGLIATPLCYLFISNWLNEYVYRISLSTNLIFATIISLAVVCTLGVLAISAKIIEAGKVNPAETLRTD